MSENELLGQFAAMFDCDTARIVSPLGTLFLIIGHKRSTKNNPITARWLRNGKPYDFEYIEEKVVASGVTLEELTASAKEYKRRLGMTMMELLGEATETTGGE